LRSEPLTVCVFGTYRKEYNRHQILVKRLHRAGINVIECHEPLWYSTEDRLEAASGLWVKPNFILRVLRAYLSLLFKGLKSSGYDVMIAGYPGQFDVPLARLITWFHRKPLVWDILMSTVQIGRERGFGEKFPITSRMLSLTEAFAVKLPDRLILDTPEHKLWFESAYHISADRIWLVPLGTDDEIFHPFPGISNPANKRFRVIYYGTFIPNHGVPYIIEAARLLNGHLDISFEFIGDGPDRLKCIELAKTYQLQNVTFLQWLERAELIQAISQAGACLGAFGNTSMAKMTLHNKIYEGLAMKLPIITADSPAVRQMFEPGKHLFTCDRGRPETLANAILALKENEKLRENLAENGYADYLQKYSISVQGKRLAELLLSLIPNHPSVNS